MSYDVFISFKNSGKDGKATPDAAAARGIYDALKGAGMKVFFSEESLAEEGKGKFGDLIETALDSARVLILVASCLDHIESPWVKREWASFLEPPERGELFIFNCGDFKPTDLPLFLRRHQMFAQSSMEKLLQFVARAVPSLPTLGDFIQVALHCFRPEKNEDKVYLVTVHPGTMASTCHVMAHWGARAAKRLSSQMKAPNVSKEVAISEVEKAKQEKLRVGYMPAAYAKLLTDEARSHLSASLGLVEAEPVSKVKAGGKSKPRSSTVAVEKANLAGAKAGDKKIVPASVHAKPKVKQVKLTEKSQVAPKAIAEGKVEKSKTVAKSVSIAVTKAAIKTPQQETVKKGSVAGGKSTKVPLTVSKKVSPNLSNSKPLSAATKKDS